MSISEGRKKIKDTKTPAKKKRTNSSDEDNRPSGSATVATGQGKINKKQKVNQEKENRKTQKVKFIHISYALRSSIIFIKIEVDIVLS